MSRADLERLARIARDAGRGIMRVYSGHFQVDYKSPGDPVTDADREANALICARLTAEFPDAAIVAEESSAQSYLGYQERARVFFVDPLDGTREFVARNGQFVVMIGLLVDDRPTLGVVYSPVSDTLWCGAEGLGAYRIDANGKEEMIRVGEVAKPEDARITVSRSHPSEHLKQVLQGINPRLVVPMGSAGLKGSHVADNSADAYLGLGATGKHWDACAMDALVSAAGGRVTDARGEPLDYRSPVLELEHGILAANPALHQSLVSRISRSES
jgi:3'(2'), 5'-bisphosphate nucleotidase